MTTKRTKRKKTTAVSLAGPKKVSPVKIRLLKFGSKTCGACIAMSKARTLEKFAEAYPNVQVVDLLIGDSRGDAPALGDAGNTDGIDYKGNYSLSDDYEVTALPTTIMEIEGVGEVVRLEGAVNVKDLKEAYETTVAYAERSKKIPWK